MSHMNDDSDPLQRSASSRYNSQKKRAIAPLAKKEWNYYLTLSIYLFDPFLYPFLEKELENAFWKMVIDQSLKAARFINPKNILTSNSLDEFDAPGICTEKFIDNKLLSNLQVLEREHFAKKYPFNECFIKELECVEKYVYIASKRYLLEKLVSFTPLENRPPKIIVVEEQKKSLLKSVTGYHKNNKQRTNEELLWAHLEQRVKLSLIKPTVALKDSDRCFTINKDLEELANIYGIHTIISEHEAINILHKVFKPVLPINNAKASTDPHETKKLKVVRNKILRAIKNGNNTFATALETIGLKNELEYYLEQKNNKGIMLCSVGGTTLFTPYKQYGEYDIIYQIGFITFGYENPICFNIDNMDFEYKDEMLIITSSESSEGD